MKSVVGSMKMEFLFYNIVSITKFIQCEKRHMNKVKATCFMDIRDFLEVTYNGSSTLFRCDSASLGK
jgi:hypothetical protein